MNPGTTQKNLLLSHHCPPRHSRSPAFVYEPQIPVFPFQQATAIQKDSPNNGAITHIKTRSDTENLYVNYSDVVPKTVSQDIFLFSLFNLYIKAEFKFIVIIVIVSRK